MKTAKSCKLKNKQVDSVNYAVRTLAFLLCGVEQTKWTKTEVRTCPFLCDEGSGGVQTAFWAEESSGVENYGWLGPFHRPVLIPRAHVKSEYIALLYVHIKKYQ